MLSRLLFALLATVTLSARDGGSEPLPQKPAKKEAHKAAAASAPSTSSAPVASSLGFLEPMTSTATASPRPEANPWGWVPRAPFHTGKVYLMKVTPGSPYYVELPMGEFVKLVHTDKEYFKAEGDDSSNRVVVTAENAGDVIGKRGRLLVETTSGLMVSVVLEVVPEGLMPAGGLSLYLPGNDPEVAAKRAIEGQAQARALGYQGELERRMRSEANRWKAETLATFKAGYHISKSGIDVDNVVSTSVQTFIYTRGLTEIPAVKLINRDRKEEVVDAEHDNGVYTVNRVLLPKEKFVLSLGSSSATIQLN